MKYLLSLFLLTSILSAAEPLSRGFVLQRQQDKSCVALVVGNSNYTDAPALKNPVSDATDVAAALKKMGFQVDCLLDADREQFTKGIIRFSDQLVSAKAAVFYYAGHGMQIGGENWLIPVAKTKEDQINDESQVKPRAINAAGILEAMEQAKVPMNLVVFDACRNNPFKAAAGVTRANRVPGLAEIKGPVGSLILYSTAAGKVAQDGENSRNSPFTTAFLKHLVTPGLDVRMLPSEITNTVGELTGGVQVPWQSASLKSGFCFVPTPTAAELEIEMKARGEKLGALEAQQLEMQRLREAEEGKIANKQKEIALMEKKIKDAEAKMKAGGDTGGDFEAIMTMVEAKEKQAKEILEMQQKVEEMAAAENKKRFDAFTTDINRFRKLAASEHGSSMKDQAWAALLKKWKVENIPVGDEGAFAKALRLEPPAGAKPTWASAGGKDQFGTWADLQVAGVTQRFRWIVPGTFTMGSPASEAERDKDEVQHEVTISKGYWMADSECTQGLWQAITGSNPAKFQDSKNPVEQVSWDDCQGFLSKLNSQVTGVSFRLPSEAEWEYACRAGTKTAFHFGATITPEQVNYNGNYPYSGAAKGLYRKKTVAVKSFQANVWGLYDMHGNVWEYCGDWYGDYPTGNVTDPSGPQSGSSRVRRGGSWDNGARDCRSAGRSGRTPDCRSSNLGFRFCAQATP